MWSSKDLFLWLQFAYAVWQFVREAKFFRIPSALLYHTGMWLAGRPNFAAPFSLVTFSLITQGAKWPIPTNNPLEQLDPDDTHLGGAHFLQRRKGTAYIVGYNSIQEAHILVVRRSQILCSKIDWLAPGLCVADAYSWGEGFDAYMRAGADIETFTARALFTSSREHFLNQNFMRLVSIAPLMLQARGRDTLSIYASLAIIALDQLSYPANLVWRAVEEVFVRLTRLWISSIRRVQLRQFVSTFLSTFSPRLKIREEVLRNFYYVRKGEKVLVFGSSCADYFHEQSLGVMAEPEHLNPFQELSQEDFDAFDKAGYNLERSFGMVVGSNFLEHRVGGSSIKTFIVPHLDSYYNFIDNEHLHFGVCERGESSRVHRIRMALKWIEDHGRLPVTCNAKGELKPVKFNVFVDMVSKGYGVLTATVKQGSWVQ